jgi:hypothetical protein
MEAPGVGILLPAGHARVGVAEPLDARGPESRRRALRLDAATVDQTLSPGARSSGTSPCSPLVAKTKRRAPPRPRHGPSPPMSARPRRPDERGRTRWSARAARVVARSLRGRERAVRPDRAQLLPPPARHRVGGRRRRCRDLLGAQAPLVTLANWQEDPHHSWAFQHMRELMPSQVIEGTDEPRPLAEALREVGGIRLETPWAPTVDALIDATETDAFLVVHRERSSMSGMHAGMTRRRRHLIMSVHQVRRVRGRGQPHRLWAARSGCPRRDLCPRTRHERVRRRERAHRPRHAFRREVQRGLSRPRRRGPCHGAVDGLGAAQPRRPAGHVPLHPHHDGATAPTTGSSTIARSRPMSSGGSASGPPGGGCPT